MRCSCFLISGTFKGAASDELCKQCADGDYADRPGSLKCKTCPEKHYCPVSLFAFLYPHFKGGHLDLPCPSEKYCDQGGKVGASVS